jgi:Tfp pilus assembly protein PilN
MPLINLIEEQRLAVRKAERAARLAFFGFVGSTMLGVVAIGFLVFQSERLKSQESELRAQIVRVKPILAQIEANKADIAAMNPRLETLEGAQQITDRWARILAHLTVQTPDSTWLTSLRSTAADPAKPIEVSLAGLSTHQEPVGEFILRLQGCEDLDTVTLKYTQEKVEQSGKAVEFEIGAGIAGTLEEVKREGEEGGKA